MLTLFILAVVLVGAYIAASKISMTKSTRSDEWDESRKQYKYTTVETNPLYGKSMKLPLLILTGLALLMVISSGALDAKEGKKYAIYDKFGGERMIDTQGLKFIWPLSRVKEWNNYIDIKVLNGKESDEALEQLEGIMDAIPMLFVDKVTAKGAPALRFAIPTGKEDFIAMDKAFRSVDNLVENTLKPTISAMMVNAGYMFSAEDYVSGEAQNFRQTFEEMMMDGAYKVKKITRRDTTYEDKPAKDNKFLVKAIKTTYTVEKVLGADGIPIRIPNDIAKNKIKVVQVILPKVALDPEFDTRLKAQRNESTKRQLFVQQTKSAKDERELILANGEKDKASRKITEELAAVTRLTKAAALVQEQEKAKELATVQLATEKITAQTVKVKADADAYVITKKVRAGITPEVELQMRLDADVQKSANASKFLQNVQFINSGGSDGKGKDGIVTDLLGAEMAKQLFFNSTVK